MKSKRAKGNALQDWIEKYLLKQYPGCSVHNQKTVSRAMPIGGKVIWVSQRNDIHGAIDIEMIRSDEKPWYIQATMHTGIGEKLKKLLTVPWPLRYVRVFVWQKKGPRLHLIKELLEQWNYKEERTERYLRNIAKVENGKWIPLRNEEV